MLRFVLAFLCLLAPAVSLAQNAETSRYPSRQISLIVPFPAGGPTDIFARILADKLQAALGQPVVVDNRVGGTGAVGSLAVARAAPDGHTLLFTSNSSHVMSPLLKNPPPFDPLKDFRSVSMMLTYPFALVVSKDVPVKTIPEFVSHARANPSKLNLGIFGRGSGGHLVSEMFNFEAKVQAVQIPYRGVADLHRALVARQIDYIFDSYGSSRPLAEAGHVNILGVTGTQRLFAAPDTPTLKEHGFLDDFNAVIWLGLVAPAKTPDAIVAKLSAEMAKIVKLPDVAARIKTFAADPVGNSPEEFVRFIQTERPAWQQVIRANDIKAD